MIKEIFIVSSGHLPCGGILLALCESEAQALEAMCDYWEFWPDLWLYRAPVTELRAMSYVLPPET